ncbi:MAG: hypothetical protein Q8N16_02970 [bacterium]|nr:hypothetical protein [bacterium]
MKKTLSFILALGLLLPIAFMMFEPEIADAVAASGEVDVTLTVTEELTLTVPTGAGLVMTAMTMTTTTSYNPAAGADWTVKTNSQDGWKLELKGDNANILAQASPAEAFTDYTEVTANTPETWSVAAGAYEFGFNVDGDGVDTAVWGAGTSCATGTDKKYQGFKGVTAIEVSDDATETSTTGALVSLCVKAEEGSSVYAPNGSYIADVTGTATSTP